MYTYFISHKFFAGDFHVVLDKIEADILQIYKKSGTKNRSFRVNHTFSERF